MVRSPDSLTSQKLYFFFNLGRENVEKTLTDSYASRRRYYKYRRNGIQDDELHERLRRHFRISLL